MQRPYRKDVGGIEADSIAITLVLPLPVEGQFPLPGEGIVTNDPLGIICCFKFEISVLRSQPSVYDFNHFHSGLANRNPARRFLTAVSCITLHLNAHDRLVLISDP